MNKTNIAVATLCGFCFVMTAHSQPYTFTTIAGFPPLLWDVPPDDENCDQPWGIALDSAGNLYVTDTWDNRIKMIRPPQASLGQTAWTISTIAGSGVASGSADGIGPEATFNLPMGIVRDGAGNLYVTDYWNNEIRMLTPPSDAAGETNWVVSTLAGTPASPSVLAMPVGIALDSAGRLYVASSLYNTIQMVEQTGATQPPSWAVSTVAGLTLTNGATDGPGNAARFSRPSGLALDRAGNLYVADAYNNEIRMMQPLDATGTNWMVSTIAGSAAAGSGSADGRGNLARFNDPTGIAVDSGGSLYVADCNNDAIRKIVPTMSNGETIWMVSTIGGLPGTSGTNDGVGSAALFDNPQGVAVDDHGNVYVADAVNGSFRMGVPGLVMSAGQLIVANGQIRLNFSISSGSASSFSLASANSPLGPWTNNAGAVLTTDVPGASYTFTAPLSSASAQFYRVQSP